MNLKQTLLLLILLFNFQLSFCNTLLDKEALNLIERVAQQLKVKPLPVPHVLEYLEEIALNEETPDSLHIVDMATLVDRFHLWQKYLPRVQPFYAVKVNPDPLIVLTLNTLGAGFDCASQLEMEQILSLPSRPDQIIFAHPRKPISSIQFAEEKDVKMMTFDSLEELKKMIQYAPHGQYVLRIKTDDSHSRTQLSTKFGATLKEAMKIIDFAFNRSKPLPLIGVSFHIGSNCDSAQSYRKAIFDSAKLFFYAKYRWKKEFTLLDLGGGWPGNNDPLFIEMSKVVNKSLDDFFPLENVKIIAEPGRYFATSTTTIAMKIIGKSSTTEGRSYYLTDGVYGSFLNSPIYSYDLNKVKEEGWNFKGLGHNDQEQKYPSRLWGPTCDSYDYILADTPLPDMNSGEYIYTQNAGSYTRSLQTPFNQITPSKVYYVYTNPN